MNEMSSARNCAEWSMRLLYTNTFSLKYFEGVSVHVALIQSRSDQCKSSHTWPGFSASHFKTHTLGKLDPLKICLFPQRNLEWIFRCWKVCKMSQTHGLADLSSFIMMFSGNIVIDQSLSVTSAQSDTVMKSGTGIFWSHKHTPLVKHYGLKESLRKYTNTDVNAWQMCAASVQTQHDPVVMKYISIKKKKLIQMYKWH